MSLLINADPLLLEGPYYRLFVLRQSYMAIIVTICQFHLNYLIFTQDFTSSGVAVNVFPRHL